MNEPHGQLAAPLKMVIKGTLLSGRPSSSSRWVAIFTTGLLFIATAVYWRNFGEALSLWPASGEAVFAQGEYLRLITALLAHADLKHLLSNSILFFILGYFLSGYFGIIMFPILSCVLGVVTNAATVYLYPPQVQLIGASGMVYAMGGLWLSLYFFVNRNQRLTQRILRFFGVGILLFAPTQFEQNVSYSAHFIGLIFGLIVGTVFFFLRKKHLRSHEWLEPEPIEIEDEPVDPSSTGLPN